MKKLFITIAFVAATMFASAQLYVGGSLGFDYSKDKIKSDETTDLTKTFSWDITPSVGYMFSDNMGVGIDLGFGMVTEKNLQTDAKDKTTLWAVAPYFRYVFAEVDNFKFYADAKVSFGGGRERTTYAGPSFKGKESYFGVAVVPGMAYMLTDNISMNCTLNILALGFQQTTIKADDDSKSDLKYVNTEFGLGVNRATPITIGFFYNF